MKCKAVLLLAVGVMAGGALLCSACSGGIGATALALAVGWWYARRRWLRRV